MITFDHDSGSKRTCRFVNTPISVRSEEIVLSANFVDTITLLMSCRDELLGNKDNLIIAKARDKLQNGSQ